MSQFHDFTKKTAKTNRLSKIVLKIDVEMFIYLFVAASRRTPAGLTMDLFEQHQGTHILQVCKF